MKRIIIDNGNGTIGILIPTIEALKTMTLHEIADKDIPNELLYEIVDTNIIPKDRTFRNAWEAKIGGVKTNMQKAKFIAHNMRRKARDELFKPLDVQATIPSQAQAAEAARQAIRDADAIKQTAIDKAITESELKAILELS